MITLALQPTRSVLHRQLLRAAAVNTSQSPLLKLEPVSLAVAPSSSRPNHRCFATASNLKLRRRKRPSYGIAKIEGTGPPKQAPTRTGLDAPYSYGGEDGSSTQEYLEKTSLSPWVPIPDPIARKLFDMSEATPEDVSLIVVLLIAI